MTATTDHRPPGRFEDELLPVLMDALAERQDQQVGERRSARHPRRRRMAGFAIAAVVLAVALVAPAVLPLGRGGADPAAAAALRRVARRAAAQPPELAPLPGQYLYWTSTSTQTYLYVADPGGPGNFSFTEPLTRETWIGTDGSGRIDERSGPVSFPTDADRAAWVAAGSPALQQGEGDQTFGPRQLSYRDYSTLPTDPTALRDLLEARKVEAGPSGDWETFEIVGDLLHESYTSPAVRGALFEVAADLPGVEMVGRVTDGEGRAGVAVAYTHDAYRVEWIFDPNTAELLGESNVLIRDTTLDTSNNAVGDTYGAVGPAGTIAYEATYLVTGVVGSVHDRP